MAPHLLEWLKEAGVAYDPDFKGPSELEKRVLAEDEAKHIRQCQIVMDLIGRDRLPQPESRN